MNPKALPKKVLMVLHVSRGTSRVAAPAWGGVVCVYNYEVESKDVKLVSQYSDCITPSCSEWYGDCLQKPNLTLLYVLQQGFFIAARTCCHFPAETTPTTA